VEDGGKGRKARATPYDPRKTERVSPRAEGRRGDFVVWCGTGVVTALHWGGREKEEWAKVRTKPFRKESAHKRSE